MRVVLGVAECSVHNLPILAVDLVNVEAEKVVVKVRRKPICRKSPTLRVWVGEAACYVCHCDAVGVYIKCVKF